MDYCKWKFFIKKIYIYIFTNVLSYSNIVNFFIQEYVIGRQCNQCKESTFGLALNNPKGCTECFCFGRTTSCQQADLSWGQRRLTRPRTLYINDTINDIIVSIVL